jgi:hypothetical protein
MTAVGALDISPILLFKRQGERKRMKMTEFREIGGRKRKKVHKESMLK